MKILYFLILRPISKLPSAIRYRLASLLSFVLYRIVKYRRSMIENNLALCFPDRNAAWVKKTTGAFYVNLGDVIIESISAFSVTKKDTLKNIRIANPELLTQLFANGKSIIMTGGHYVNWEVMTQIGNRIPFEFIALYKPLKNKFMDQKVRASRERFGTKMISIKAYRQTLVDLETAPKAFLFGIDQSPRQGRGIWMDFINRETLVFTGPERLSKEFDMSIVTGRMQRIARGQYEVKFELLTENPRETKDNFITLETMKDVEAQVNAGPAGWLWSHNRWKHSKPE